MKKYTFPVALNFLFLFAAVCNAQTGLLVTVAGGNGSGAAGAGDGLTATNPAVEFGSTRGVCADPLGNIYITDASVPRVRKVDAVTRVVQTVAGTNTKGFSGDGGPATNAQFNSVEDICMDNAGNLYIGDQGNGRIRKVNAATGIISTVAGGGGSTADGVPATNAKIFAGNFYVDASGNIYFMDGGDKIRMVNAITGLINTIAGNGSSSFSGDGGPATNAALNEPYNVTGDVYGNIYFTDQRNNRVRKINSSGIISTIAGDGTNGYSGDGGLAISAQLNNPVGIGIDGAGNIYFSDWAPGFIQTTCVRRIDAVTGIISTIAGCISGCPIVEYDTVGASALSKNISIYNLCVDVLGNIYFSDYGREIRKVTNTSAIIMNADSFFVSVNYMCNGPQLSVVTHRYSPGMSVKTYYGDGTNDITTISGSSGKGYALINHSYHNSGTYTIKQVLYNGTIPTDSLTFLNPYAFCRTLPVSFYYDANTNCEKDSGEPYSVHPIWTEVYANGVPVNTLSATSGFYYNAYGNPGDIYTFKVLSMLGNSYISCPLLGTWSDTLQSTVSSNPPNYVGFSCGTSAGFDLSESVSFLCGKHAASADIIINNSYCTPENAILTMQFSNKYIFGGASPAPTSVSGNTLTWDIAGLSATISNPFHIHTTLAKSGISDIPFGDTINSNYIVTPFAGDINTANNTVVRIDTVTSSFDPNEMSVSPAGYISAGTQLEYTINFENTGNDTAFNIYVMDTLSAYVDMNTLNIEASSAVMNTTILTHNDYNIVKFDFPNINLLDSSHQNECEGLVMFNIKTKAGTPSGTEIFNHAGIFFDNNPVVMTNTVEDIIGSPLSVAMPKKEDDVMLYPNPTTGDLTIKMDNNAYSSFIIYNTIGQIMMQNAIKANQTKVTVNKLPTGVYYISLKGDNGAKVLEFVKM